MYVTTGAAGLDIPMPRALVEVKFAQGPCEVKQMVVPGKPSGSETVT